MIHHKPSSPLWVPKPLVVAVCLAANWFGLFSTVGRAANPAWWTTSGAVTASAPNDQAVASQGQLKLFTVKAVQELNAHLPGDGAGTTLNSLVATWQQDYATNNYANDTSNPTRPYKPADFDVVTIGQLKYIASLIAEQLRRGGYRNPPTWIAVNQAVDKQLATLGQVKKVFAFDLTTNSDANGDGVPDWWENFYFQTTYVPLGDLSPNGDGLSILQSYQQGFNPLDYYNGIFTLINVDSGNGQSTAPNSVTLNPLVVRVTDGVTNAVKAHAPIVFASASGQLALAPSGPFSASLTVPTDSQGRAAVYLKMPSTGIFTQVTATADNSAQVVFNECLAQLLPTPSSFSLSVDRGEVQERTLTLINTTSQSVGYVVTPALLNAGYVPGTPQDANNPEYNWLDSTMPGGPMYVWNDISSTGTLLTGVSGGPLATGNNDDNYQQITLPFSFPFYGTNYSSVYVSSNGFLSFGSGSLAWNNTALPNASLPPMIAPFFDNLDPSRNGVIGKVYMQASASNIIIQYDGVAPEYDPNYPNATGTYTFQVVLESSGTITFYYKAMNNVVNSATVGIQGGISPSHGRQIVYNQDGYIYNGLAIRFAAPAPLPFVQLRSGSTGTVASGQSANIDVLFDSTVLAAGTYTATLHLKNGVGNTVGPDVPVAWTVSGTQVVDSDGDGLPDAWEMQHFGNLNQGANDDPDHDGLSNLMEYRLGSDPDNSDTNSDGVLDGVAYRAGISVTNMDMNGNGVSNATERQWGLNPFAVMLDGQYLLPLDPTQPAATSASLNNNTPLTITLLEPVGAVLQH